MKHKLQYIIFLLLLSGAEIFSSCNKDFLTRNPLDKISSGTFWKTQSDVDLALTGCYGWVSNGSGAEGWGALTPHWEGISDNAYDQYPWENGFTTVAKGQIESTSGGIVSDVYYTCYKAIASCNYFLANVGTVKLDDSTLNRYEGEVRFLRAYFYFELTECYGGVPLILHPMGVDSSGLAQATQAQVTQAILADLDFAIANLPNIAYSGHAVKGSALGLKARVLLYNNQWQAAAAAAQQVIAGNTFHLNSDYSGMFDGTDQANNPEIMFSAKYLNPNMYSALDLYYAEWLSSAPLANLVNSYECSDGLPTSLSPLYNPLQPYNNRDPRLRMTIFVPGDPDKGRSSGIFDPSQNQNILTGFGWKKYLNMANLPADYSTRSDQNFVILRYADILLMYAEAQNEAVGPDPTVYNAVNAVRSRSGVNMPPLLPGLTQSQMRDAIRLERRVEFAMEGTRYFDLKRWGIADQVLPTIQDPGGTNRKFDQHNYLWPFPQSEIDIDKNLKQNPGY